MRSPARRWIPPRRGHRIAVFGALLALPSAAYAHQQGPQLPDSLDEPDAPILLEFGWQPGMTATVEVAQRTLRRGQGASDTDMTLRSTYRMEVAEHDEGLLVRNFGGSLREMVSDPPMQPGNPLRLMFEAMQGIESAYVVSADGELLEVRGGDEAAAAFRASLSPLFDSIGGQEELAPMVATFEGLVSPDAMTASATEQWMGMVWVWAWEELEEGAVYAFEGEEPSPLVPDVVIPMDYEMGFLEYVPCTEESTASECVQVELYSYPDPEAVKELMARWVERMGALMQGASLVFDEFDQENRIQVVLNPTDLVPYAYRTSKLVRGVIREDGEASEFARLDESELLFRYESTRLSSRE